MSRCIAFCLTKRFDFEALREHFTGSYRTTLYRDALHLEAAGDLFLFEFGVMVLWGIEQDLEQRLLAEIEPYCIEPLSEPFTDTFQFEENISPTRIHEDTITLSGDSVREKLAISHGIAQSVKLSELEAYAEKTIDESAHIPQNMAKTGSSQLGRRTIARMRGRLFLVESDINLHYALLDTPEFFWEYPEVEELYAMTARYLDVQARTELLNRKLNVIHEMFGMLADEQKHKHSSMLEWIIIWLIAFEIAIFFVHDLFKWI
jgi:uncharacterized Rmd1/YagE family protein